MYEYLFFFHFALRWLNKELFFYLLRSQTGNCLASIRSKCWFWKITRSTIIIHFWTIIIHFWPFLFIADFSACPCKMVEKQKNERNGIATIYFLFQIEYNNLNQLIWLRNYCEVESAQTWIIPLIKPQWQLKIQAIYINNIHIKWTSVLI